jgi:hypothetical protein
VSGADDWEKVGDSAPQAGGGEDWEPVQLADRPTPTVGDALPEAFLARVGQGQALAQVLNKGGERGVADKLFGLSGERFQLWPERMLRSGFTLAHDVMSGELPTNVIDPVSGEVKTNPEMIARSMDMAGFQLAQTHISPTVPRAAPLVDLGSGRFARPEVGPDGALQAKTVGSVPAEADFAAASKVLDTPAAEPNLHRMWQEEGIHPAEAVHDAEQDAFLKHQITAPHEEIKLDPETEKVLDETGGAPGSLSAAMTPPDEIPG